MNITLFDLPGKRFKCIIFCFSCLLVVSSCRSQHRDLIDAESRIKDHQGLQQKKRNVWVFILAGQSNMAGRGEVEPGDAIAHGGFIISCRCISKIVYAAILGMMIALFSQVGTKGGKIIWKSAALLTETERD